VRASLQARNHARCQGRCELNNQRNGVEVLTAWIPLTIAIALLGLFIVPNYLHAGAWKQEASGYRAVANESAARQDSLIEIQHDVERLRMELNQRGKVLPNTPDKGGLLTSVARTADNKGVYTHQSKSGKLTSMDIPGVQGAKTMRRTVDVQMTGTFDSLFGAVRTMENLKSLVTVRSIEFACNPKAPQDISVIDASFAFDEYFTDRAVDATVSTSPPRGTKAGAK
jgi:Tfp pilus assembly protein PilO